MRMTFILSMLLASFLWQNTSNAQSFEYIGDSLFQLKEFKRAGLYYQRAAFEKKADNIVVSRILLKKAYALKAQSNYEQALEAIYKIGMYGLPDSLVYKLSYEKILLFYLTKKFPAARNEWHALVRNVRDSNRHDQARYLYIITLNQLQEWEIAKEELAKFITHHNLPDSAASFYNFVYDNSLKSPEKAKILSTFLPGLGQIYTRNYKEAVISFLLNGMSVTFTVWHIINHYYLIGAGAGGYMSFRFYSGGRKNAEFLAEQYNEHIINQNIEKIKEYLYKNL